MSQKSVFLGLIASTSSNNISIKAGFLTVENGKINKMGCLNEFENLDKLGAFSNFNVIKMAEGQLLIPGFIDCHTHGPQYPNLGIGLDKPLLEWLDKYTFPLEKMYGEVEFAAKVYDNVVKKLLNNGTTTACYFGTLHLEGTLELVKSAIKNNQRAFVGKVSMNLINDASYYNDTQEELRDTESFIKKVLEHESDLVQPIVTPRFAVSCDMELMKGLANIANKYNCRIQSHICENHSEIEYVLQINPDCSSYGEVYEKSQILNSKCIMAHAVHMTDKEIQLLQSRGVSIAHCPASNTRLRSGLCPAKKLINSNIKVGLGTDVSGGDSASILDAIRRTMDVSMCIELNGTPGCIIDWKEAFYLATMGGAKALNLDDKIGSLEIGKEFDALLIDIYAEGGPIDKYDYQMNESSEEHALSLLQRFIYLGDDRNIVQVYVKGELVKNLK